MLPDWVFSVVWATVFAVVIAVWICAVVFYVVVAYYGLRWLLRRLRR